MNNLGIIGFGNMGSCIAERIKSKDLEIWVFDKDKTKTAILKNKTANLLDIRLVENSIDLVKRVETVILAVKPQDFDNILNEIKEGVEGKLIISIAAGIATSDIEKYLGEVRVIRVMPNMPARIGKGISCICKGKYADDDDLNFSQRLFDELGETLILKENMMDEATAVSGSGPGYFFHLIENKKLDVDNQGDVEKFRNDLSESASNIGFSAQQAKILAEATTSGSVELIKVSNLSAQELEKQIVSKGGTTEAGLEHLYDKSPYNLLAAVKAALKRAKELSKK